MKATLTLIGSKIGPDGKMWPFAATVPDITLSWVPLDIGCPLEATEFMPEQFDRISLDDLGGNGTKLTWTPSEEY